MNVLYMLIGFSVVVAAGFLFAFLWAVKKGQFDDQYGDARRILHDDEVIKK